MKTIKLGDTIIGEGCPVYFIAEIGINHNGDMQIAKKLIDAAFVTNWNCVKFQKRTPSTCIPENQKDVMRSTPWGEMTYLDYRYRVEFEKKQYDYINNYCREKPIHWSASVWDIKSLEFILNYDIPFIKIPSAKITDDAILSECAKSGKPVFFSSGMSTLEEVDNAVNVVDKYTKEYVLFHTNSSYPAKHKELNLKLIETLRKRYGCIIGYSGHEYDIEPSVIAAVLGAKVIERHITINHNLWGTDQAASLEIDGMLKLFNRVADILPVLGNGQKIITDAEFECRKKLRI
ncbi:MAG: N-acetylneuraminate synthase family protein [Prevotella sp.]|jgi:N-acetylneuraminate synthase|nr:N-acetylneuraminate synthase family protein [Prevotella sp.]